MLHRSKRKPNAAPTLVKYASNVFRCKVCGIDSSGEVTVALRPITIPIRAFVLARVECSVAVLRIGGLCCDKAKPAEVLASTCSR